jgi:hypothetical protein
MRPAAPEDPPQARNAFDVTPPPANRFPRWIPVGALGVVVLILGLHFRSGPGVPEQSPPAPMVAAPLPKASPAGEGASTPGSKVSKPVSQPVSKLVSKPPHAASKRSPAGEGMWRVIAFTFRTHAAAVKKVAQINQRHPRLQATVFSPKERQGYYLVALGGRMSHEEALRMEKKARGEHVSPDLFVHNYLE